jgi:hypothetical protein
VGCLIGGGGRRAEQEMRSGWARVARASTHKRMCVAPVGAASHTIPRQLVKGAQRRPCHVHQDMWRRSQEVWRRSEGRHIKRLEE